MGLAGLRPVMAAATKGTDIAIATKEVLVAAGDIVTEACRGSGARLLPVDSEHNAIFQCLDGRSGQGPAFVGCEEAKGKASVVRRLILTASGGPFAGRPEIDLAEVKIEDALAHPKWDMGPKVTIDSATLMNKGLEIMEAAWLFAVEAEKVDVVIHRESIVHSMVEFVDGSVMAQLSIPDMRFAIQHVLLYPERLAGDLPELTIADMGELHFEEPDMKRFPCLRLAKEAAECGGTMPCVLNAANEVAVSRFLSGELKLPGIWALIEGVMSRHDSIAVAGMNEIVETDAWARRIAGEI